MSEGLEGLELAGIVNARAGHCMCGRDESVTYGPHPIGYGPCCVHCQREWSRMHGGAPWQSNAEQLARLRAAQSRAIADGRSEREVVAAWNQGLPPFERPEQVAPLSDQWKREYDAWSKREGIYPSEESS